MMFRAGAFGAQLSPAVGDEAVTPAAQAMLSVVALSVDGHSGRVLTPS